MVEPYIADDEGRVALKPDYVDIVAAAQARGRLTTTNANAETNPKRKRPSKMNSVQPRQPSDRNQDRDRHLPAAMLTYSDPRLPDPKTYAEAMKSDEAELWQQAVTEENPALKRNILGILSRSQRTQSQSHPGSSSNENTVLTAK